MREFLFKKLILIIIKVRLTGYWKNLIIQKEIMKPKRQIFASLGEKPIKIWNVWENFKIYIRKSQWKIDFLPIFSPIFQELCQFIQLWKIKPFFYNNFSVSIFLFPPPPLARGWGREETQLTHLVLLECDWH